MWTVRRGKGLREDCGQCEGEKAFVRTCGQCEGKKAFVRTVDSADRNERKLTDTEAEGKKIWDSMDMHC